VGVGEPGDDAKAGPAGARLDQAVAVVEEPGVAAELVDQEALDHRGVFRVEDRKSVV